MALSLVLVVLVSTSELGAPGTLALRRAAQEVLGNSSEVRVRGYETAPEDEELAAFGDRADAVAEVTWQDSNHERALVHCYLGRSHRFISRELLFDRGDELAERGRMVGFAIASMLPKVGENEPPAPSDAEPKGAELSTAPSRVAPEEPPRQRPALFGRRALGAIDASALGALGIRHPGNGLGVGVAGRWFFHPSLSLRLSGGLRYGDVPSVHAQSTCFFAGLGLGFQFTSPDPSSRFVFGGRADALVSALTLRRGRADDGIPETQTHTQPAVDLLTEGAWYFAGDTAFLFGGGVEFGLGHTDLVVRNQEIGDLATLRLVGELGVRVRF